MNLWHENVRSRACNYKENDEHRRYAILRFAIFARHAEFE